MIENIILAGIIVFIIAMVLIYIIKAKKKGAVCIGCSYSYNCSGKKSCMKENNKKTDR